MRGTAQALHVGLYYSLADWRIPAHWAGPKKDSEGWKKFQSYIHGQVRDKVKSLFAIIRKLRGRVREEARVPAKVGKIAFADGGDRRTTTTM